MTVLGLVVKSHHNPSLSPVDITTDVISKVIYELPGDPKLHY